MGIERDILKTLNRKATSYDELKEVFPQETLAQILIGMEKKQLVKNKGGIWTITKEGTGKIGGKKPISLVVYSLLAVPIVVFFLLSMSYHGELADIQDHNQQLLQVKAETEQQLSATTQQKEDAEAVYTSTQDELEAEQDTTVSLNTSYQEEQHAIDSLSNEITKYKCRETCTPDAFVTVDNPYVKAKVDEITAGLTTLREKQEAVYEFVRDEIEEEEYVFGAGRMDLWEYPEDILRKGKGQDEDKFVLLLTMLRIVGTPPEYVRFLVADVDGGSTWIWVEFYDGTTWWLLDPLEGYEFTSTPRDTFFAEHDVIILWWFNDTGCEVVE